MTKDSFNKLVDSLAKTAVSCDFAIGDAVYAIWDGIADAGYTWLEEHISRDEFDVAVAAATPLVEELEDFYNSIVSKHMRAE